MKDSDNRTAHPNHTKKGGSFTNNKTTLKDKNALFEDANKLLNKVKMELSVQEENFVRQLLATKAIPSPKLMIKYHKTINKKE